MRPPSSVIVLLRRAMPRRATICLRSLTLQMMPPLSIMLVYAENYADAACYARHTLFRRHDIAFAATFCCRALRY